MKLHQFIPAPGIAILTPLAAASSSSLTLTTDNPTRLLQGTVVAVGKPLVTDFDATIAAPVKVGERVIFLSYEGNYDNFIEGSEKYYAVKFQDIRVIIRP